MAMVANVVQLVNEGDTVFDMKYGPRDRLILQPGQSVYVQEEVGWHYLGRWWTNNGNPRNRERQAEIDRLRTLYGAYEDEVIWQASKPAIVAYTADGHRITSVVDDPSGELSNPAGQTQFGREQSLEAQMAVLQQQLLVMQSKLERRERDEANHQPEAPAEAIPAPTAVAHTPQQQVATVGSVTVPVAPMPVLPPTGRPGGARPVPKVEGEATVGVELPVQASVAYTPPSEESPSLDDVPTDAPARIPTGGRIPAGQ
jgi:hypothetical protein